MNRTSDEVPVATAAPLLRVALTGILLVAALAGALVASSPLVAWLALAVALVAGPVAVMVDGRARSRAEQRAVPGVRDEQPRGLELDESPARLAA
jgi:hypothetical protein